MREEFQRHLQLGRHLYHSHAYERAAREFEAALAIEPDNNYARLLLARVLNSSNRPKEARREIEVALQNNPDDADAHYMASFVTPTFKHFKEALASIETALRLVPDKAEYHAHRAYLLERRGKFHESLESARHALELSPDSANAHRQIAATLLHEPNRQGRLSQKAKLESAKRDEAAFHVAAALRLEPEEPYSHALEAQLHCFDRDYEASLLKWQEALRLNPNYKYAHRHLPLAKGQVQLECFAKSVWKVCFRWMPWPLPLPLMIGLTLWSFWWNPLAFVLTLSVTLLVWPFIACNWLRFIPARFLDAPTRVLKRRCID